MSAYISRNSATTRRETEIRRSLPRYRHIAENVEIRKFVPFDLQVHGERATVAVQTSCKGRFTERGGICAVPSFGTGAETLFGPLFQKHMIIQNANFV